MCFNCRSLSKTHLNPEFVQKLDEDVTCLLCFQSYRLKVLNMDHVPNDSRIYELLGGNQVDPYKEINMFKSKKVLIFTFVYS